MYQKGIVNLYIVLAIVFILIIGTAFYLVSQTQKPSSVVSNPQPQASTVALNTFEDCIKAEGSKVLDGIYPRICVSKEQQAYKNAITAIEQVKVPVDTSNWKIVNDVKGFSFKCPPSWSCTKYSDTSANISQSHYLGISAFYIDLITPNNFQKSEIRNPNYSTPIAWFNDLSTKNPKALEVAQSTIKFRPGTDGQDYPSYASYDLNQMQEVTTEDKVNGLTIQPNSKNIPNSYALIPLNKTDLVSVLISPEYIIEDPIIKAIITSIKPN